MRVISLLREAKTHLTAARLVGPRGRVSFGRHGRSRRAAHLDRDEIEAVLHLLVIVDPSEGELDFLDIAGKVPHAPITFSLGDDDPSSAPHWPRSSVATCSHRLHATAYPREAVDHRTGSRRRAGRPHAAHHSSPATNPSPGAFDALDGVRDDLWKARSNL